MLPQLSCCEWRWCRKVLVFVHENVFVLLDERRTIIIVPGFIFLLTVFLYSTNNFKIRIIYVFFEYWAVAQP